MSLIFWHEKDAEYSFQPACLVVVWFDFLVQLHINLRGVFNGKAILVEKQQWFYVTYIKGIGVHDFPKGISLRVKLIARL